MRYPLSLFLFAGVFGSFSTAHPQSPRALISPEVHSDRRVTFRFRDPGAGQVFLSLEGSPRTPMQKGEDGVWTFTTTPLEPDVYSYTFVVNGISLMDPLNPLVVPNLLNPASAVYIPGGGMPWDPGSVPRGVLHRHFYHSTIIGDDRDYYVYTPPGYDPRAKKSYPVLYLLHGYSDDASAWTSVGRAHIISDNLIAQGKAQPMLIVMPLGYGAPEIVSRLGPGFRDASLRERSFKLFRQALFEEVMPTIEKEYRVSRNRAMRAIAGLSMGGAESLYVGLNATDRFAYIGAFSSGGLSDDHAVQFPRVDARINSQLRLLWISCGTEDQLIESNRKLVRFLQSRQVIVDLREVPGTHNWRVWRRNLADLLPLLFQKR
jgi:enterochelin esterase family protein